MLESVRWIFPSFIMLSRTKKLLPVHAILPLFRQVRRLPPFCALQAGSTRQHGVLESFAKDETRGKKERRGDHALDPLFRHRGRLTTEEPHGALWDVFFVLTRSSSPDSSLLTQTLHDPVWKVAVQNRAQ